MHETNPFHFIATLWHSLWDCFCGDTTTNDNHDHTPTPATTTEPPVRVAPGLGLHLMYGHPPETKPTP